MLKYLFLVLYVLIANYLYKTFLYTMDTIKAKYEEKYSEDSKLTKSRYFAICDFIYILIMSFWPIFILSILIRIIKRGKTYVHKGQNSGGDGEGTHQD